MNELFYVFNVTDGILACPDKMTEGAADEFMQSFPKRYYAQGYYKTANGVRMDPDNVLLSAIPAGEWESAQAHGMDDFSDIRNRDDVDEHDGDHREWYPWNTSWSDADSGL